MSTIKEEVIFVTDDEVQQARSHYEDSESKVIVLAWGDSPPERHRETLKRARLKSKQKKSELPSGLAALQRCESLLMPSNMTECLTEESALPPSVVHIGLSGKRKVRWPEGLVLAGIRRLGVGDNTLTLHAGALPNLESIGLALDNKLERLQVLEHIERLEDISLTNVNSEAALVEVARLSPEGLDLVDGKVESINALRGFKRLSRLKLARLTRLKFIEPLTALNELRDLYIHTCKKIADAATVLPSLKHLDSLRVIACGRIGLEEIDEVLQGSIPTYIRSGSR